MKDFKNFPKISEKLNNYLEDNCEEALSLVDAQNKLKFTEILDDDVQLDIPEWHVERGMKKQVPVISGINGDLNIPPPKRYKGGGLLYTYDFQPNIVYDDLCEWSFIFQLMGLDGKNRMGVNWISPEERKRTNVPMLFFGLHKVIIKFFFEVQPTILEYSGADNTLDKAYSWMSKILSKELPDYAYDVKNTTHYFTRTKPRSIEAKTKYPEFSDNNSTNKSYGDTTHIFTRIIPRSPEAEKLYPESKEEGEKYYSNQQESLTEKVTLPDLMKDRGMSLKSKYFRSERYKIMGQEQGNSKFIECKLTKNHSIDYYFLSESTRKYKKGTKRKNADIHQGYRLSDNPSETYQITIRVLNFLDWISAFPDIKEVTTNILREILRIAQVEMDSSVPSFYWQGAAYNLKAIGGTIYKQSIRKPQNKKNKGWARPYPKGHGEAGIFLDKISQSICNNIVRYIPDMAKATTKLLKEKRYL